ncbi:MAG: hypothetical protein IPJ19_07885 [Planctomycetes bacterium]|nr:hypothetical protein [Planctomycetota bacterium]
MPAPENWVQMSDEELLEQNIARLGLKLEGTGLEAHVQQLYAELDLQGLAFHPPCHLGDEWFCPVGIPAIFVPFFLAHPRLRELERKQILEVEGETSEWFMKLLRHEAAHAYSYAYRLQHKKKWQEQFGLASTEESDTYRPRPYSKSYVIHLDDWYAQSHPDEDWAETFAVWLTPGLDWRERYKGWKALQKLEYTEELMRSLAGKPPVHAPQYRVSENNFLNLKLKTFYARKRREYADSFPDFYDNDLRKLFPAQAENEGTEKASTYLRRRRRQVVNAVARWSNEHKFRIDQLLRRILSRCDELALRVQAPDPNLDLQVAAYVTSLTKNYLFTGKFKRTK